jgi:MYXO-CTERM domain-containing protein
MLRFGVRGSIATAACLLASVATSMAAADGPAVTLDVTVDASSQSLGLIGTATNLPNVFNYQGSLLDAGGAWLLSWDFNASDSTNAGTKAFTAGNYVIQNLSTDTIAVELTVTLPIALVGSALYGGSVSGGLTTSGPGFISDDGTALWSASTGAALIDTLFNAPFNVARADAGSSSLGFESFGDPIPSAPGPDFGADISVTLKFLLGANSSASFTSVLVAAIPTPGALALLGLGGLTAFSRRRRHA